MADVLTTGVWNRIMVVDLGFSAAFVGLLTGLRYFLAPLGIIAGRYSDTHAIGGYRRLFWIWLGRAMMALSTVALGFSTAELVQRAATATEGGTPATLWLALVLSFLFFSLGSAISGSTFLALIYDRAPEEQRGRAVGLVWTFLLIGFTIGGIFFSVLLPSDSSAIEQIIQSSIVMESGIPVKMLREGRLSAGDIGFSAQSVLVMFLLAAAVFSLLWFFSLLGEERRVGKLLTASAQDSGSRLRADLALVWRSPPLRYFLFYLTLSMAFAFLQDNVLEPFAGEVFGMEASTTNRFAAYWGGMAILASFAVLFLSRRYARFTHSNVSQAGVILLLAAYGIFAVSDLAEIRPLVRPGLIFLGIGLGVWNIGTLGLMMDMSPTGRAGTFLGFWTFCVTLARGAGVAGGGIILDGARGLSGAAPAAYGTVFCCGFVGLLLAWLALCQVRLADYHTELSPDEELAAVFAHSLE